MTINKYSKEFKLDAISLVTEQGYSRTEAAVSLGIRSQMLGRWIRENEDENGHAFRGQGKLTGEQLENTPLEGRKQAVENGERNSKKGGGLLCSGNKIKYSFIMEHKKTWSIALMCQLFGVRRNGYYNYQKRYQNKPVLSGHQKMLSLVKKLLNQVNTVMAVARMQKALNALGYPVGRNKTRSLMKEAHIQVRYRKKYKVTTNSNHKNPVYENVLNRQFVMQVPNQAYASDITYIWTQEGWLYLAIVIDLYSRKIVGWSMSSRMKANLVCDALRMAIWQRHPAAGLIVHTDRGSQYASKVYRQLLKKHGYIGSMSRKGNCWDNAVPESFFGRLKQERVQWRCYQTRREAQQDILDYITMFYNPVRLHSFLGYSSPNQHESNWSNLKKVA